MRLKCLFVSLALTTQLFAYQPQWWCDSGYCGDPAGSRERFPRHEVCCNNGNCRKCNGGGDCCQEDEPQAPAPCYSPCYQYECRLGGTLEISGDLLYWNSSRPPVYAWSRQSNAASSFNNAEEINPGYDWGVRGFGQWNLPCSNWYLRGGYLYLRVKDASSIRGADIVVPWINLGAGGVADVANAELKLTYQRAEFLAGYNIYETRCNRFFTYGGGVWIDMSQNYDSSVFGRNNTGTANARLSSRAKAAGIGALVGFGGQYHITQGLYALARFGGMAIAAERTLNERTRATANVIGQGQTTSTYPAHWGLFPGVEVAVAVRYTGGICGFWLSGEIGWELHHYFEALRQAPLQPGTPQTSFTGCGFGGPHAGLRLRF